MRDRSFIHKPDPVQTSLRNLKLDQKDHGRALGKLRSSLQTPTHPIYPTDPDDPVETQIAWRGEKEAPEYYRNGAWHPFADKGSGYETAHELLHAQTAVDAQGVQPEYTTDPLYDAGAFDNTYYRGFYSDNSGVNGSDCFLMVRLGPHGSYWHLQFVLEKGPDFGKLLMEWGQFSFGEDADPAGGLVDPKGALESITLAPSGPPTFYGVITNRIDCYAAGTQKNITTGTWSQFRIAGEDGDVVSANGASEPDSAIQTLSGGPGIWWLHLKTDGKNVSSSGYRIRLSSILLARESYWNFSAV